MDLQQSLADISLKTMSQLHRAIVHLTGGQVLGSAFGMPVVELHTVGRKSGQPRSTMLTAPVIEGDRVVLVASNADFRAANSPPTPDRSLTRAWRICPGQPVGRCRVACGRCPDLTAMMSLIGMRWAGQQPRALPGNSQDRTIYA